MDESLACSGCGRRYAPDEPRWRCDCGGLLDWSGARPFDPGAIETATASLWRYAAWLPDVPRVTLGEGWTPLLRAAVGGRDVWFKADHQNPTGSFKDRGAAVQVSRLAALGVDSLVEDSSGNAGSALAIYAARAGLRASIYVPADAPTAKLRMIREAGAELVTIDGDREAVGRAARQAQGPASTPAMSGTRPTVGLPPRRLRDRGAVRLAGARGVVVPLGNGALLLGLAIGFEHLHRSGVFATAPRLIGVQAAACAPLAEAWQRGQSAPVNITPGPTMAGGVAVAKPARGAQILAAVRRCGGRIVAVREAELATTRAALARAGWYLEPTGALAAAALGIVPERGEVVVMLTGHGLKGA